MQDQAAAEVLNFPTMKLFSEPVLKPCIICMIDVQDLGDLLFLSNSLEVILQSDVEVEAVSSVGEAHPNEGTPPVVIHNLDDKVSGAVRDRLHRSSRVCINWTGCKQFSRILILQLQADLDKKLYLECHRKNLIAYHLFVYFHDSHSSSPVRIRQIPICSSVSSSRLPWGYLVHKDLKC